MEEGTLASDIESKIAHAERVLEQRRQLVQELEKLGAEAQQTLGDWIPGLRTWTRSLQPSSKGQDARLSWRDVINGDDTAWQERCAADPDMAKLLSKVIDHETQLAYEKFKWDIIKRCHALTGVGNSASFPRSPPEVMPVGADGVIKLRKPPRSKWVSVEAVVDSGNEWIKIVSLTEKTLLYQMAEAGCWDESDEEEDDTKEEISPNKDPSIGLSTSEEDITLVRTLKDILFAARLNHTRRLRVVFTKIEHGRTNEIDELFERIRISCDTENMLVLEFANGDFLAQPVPPFETAIENLLQRDPFVDITETANLDPSVMLGLISDINHGGLEKQGPEHKTILNWTLRETEDSTSLPRDEILIKNTYPTMQGRRLVCTRAAANYFLRVVNLLATNTEMERARLVLLADPAQGQQQKSPDDLLREFRALTNYPVPDNLRLPIEIVDDFTAEDVQPAIDAGILPKMAAAVSKGMSDLNRSIYFHGWANDITTVSSHRGVVRQVELLVAQNWERPGDYGPHVWQRWMAGFLLYRDKPRDWLEMIGGTAPPELRRWLDGRTTWGRGINIFGITDSPTWEGVGTWVEDKGQNLRLRLPSGNLDDK